MDTILNHLFKAAEIHSSIKQELLDSTYIKHETPLINICQFIESRIRDKSSSNEYNNGIAFPTGVSLNNCAAHWTPKTKYDKTVFKENDVLKIDYGVHVNGCIIDSAFTFTLNDVYNPLLEASRHAVSEVIKHCGVDMSISELGTISEEIVNSYEIELNGKLIPIKPINNLCGHSISQWNIHSGKFIQGCKNTDMTRIEDNDFLAIEIFTSNGRGSTVISGESTHFAINPNRPLNIYNKKTKGFYKELNTMFKTLPFCQRFIDYNDISLRPYDEQLRELVKKGVLYSYPPLNEIDKNAYVAQFEHTIYVSETKKIKFT